MNKPTREQIEHRAIELMFNEENCCDFCDKKDCLSGNCTSVLMKTALRKAEEELKDKLFLTDKQKDVLRSAIEKLEEATGHKYEDICYDNSDITNKHMAFLWHLKTYCDNQPLFKARTYIDRVSGTFVSFADEVFENGKVYKLEEILK